MLRSDMKKSTWSPQAEIDMLKQSVAEEQKQKYAAYKRIEELQKELNAWKDSHEVRRTS